MSLWKLIERATTEEELERAMDALVVWGETSGLGRESKPFTHLADPQTARKRLRFLEWAAEYLRNGWDVALSDILRDPSNEGLWNVNNFTEAHIRRVMGGAKEKGLRLHTVLLGLIKMLQKMEKKLANMAAGVK